MNTTTAIPSLELYQVAVEKALTLKDNEQIYLTADTYTYIVLKFQGKHLIGLHPDSHLQPFFKTREILNMRNGAGEITYNVQILFNNTKQPVTQ